MNKLKFALIPAACFLVGAFCNFGNALTEKKAADTFHALTETMFRQEIVSNTLNLHFTVENPEVFGISDYPVTFGENEPLSLVLSESMPAYEQYRSALHAIPYEQLSLDDRITYDVLTLALENEKIASAYTLYEEPLGPTIGTQAQLPVLLCEYAFYDTDDIEEYLALITQTDDYFASLIEFETAKSKAGLFMSDANAEAIIKQCRAFVGSNNAEENLLVTVFNERTDDLDFLSDAEKKAYQAQNLSAVADHVLPAYKQLADGLTALKGTGKNANGLSYFPSGKSYYAYLLRRSTGSYLPVDAIERRIRQQLANDLQALQQLLLKNPSAAEDTFDGLPSDPDEILMDLQQKMKEDFPAPPNVSARVEYVHESLEKFLSPAFYLTPPIDNIGNNVIYINSAQLSTPLELYTTLAHEGYPGHLYQNISSHGCNPVRSLFSFGGYTEGWATYVEMESFSYASDNAQYWRLNRSVMLGISSLLDICIHYHGYTRSQTADFLQSIGLNTANTDALFDTIIESPANYLKYYLGYLSFLDLRTYCEKNWPEKFSLKNFHEQILKIAPAPFPVVEKYLKLYYASLS